nr:hypothetical protein K-LCC10_0011 [Kaumoebavirus]
MELPREIMMMIAGYCDDKRLRSLRRVCREYANDLMLARIFAKKWNWERVVRSGKVSAEFLVKNRMMLKRATFRNMVCQWQKLPESLMSDWPQLFNWGHISRYQTLTPEFISRHAAKLNWNLMSKYQDLTEDLMVTYHDRLTWRYIWMYQTLSEPFIEKFMGKLGMCGRTKISKFQALTEPFIEKHWRQLNKHELKSNPYLKVSKEYRKKLRS